jgi:hypothetical protein
MRFGFVTGFTEHLQNVTTNKNDSLTQLHAQKITVTTYTTHNVFSVFTSRCPVAGSNSGRSPSSGFPTYRRPQLPASHFSQLHLSTGSTDSTTQSQSQVKVKVTVRLAIYRQSVRPGAKPLETFLVCLSGAVLSP